MEKPQDSTAPESKPSRGFFDRFRTFNTKFLFVTGLSVLVGAVLNAVVALRGIHTLSEKSASQIEANLDSSSREYLMGHLADTAQRTDSALQHAYSDLEILTQVVQATVDRGEQVRPMLEAAAAAAPMSDHFIYNPKGNWFQTASDEPTVVTVWGYLGEGGSVKPDVSESVRQTAYLDLLLPAFQERGAQKLQVYYVGPWEQPYVRLAPYTDLGTTCDKMYPGYNEKNWYDFFFPNLVASWQAWAREPGKLQSLRSQVTVLAPYEDAAGGGMVTTAFHPIWTKDRRGFAGAVGLDLTLKQLFESIKDVRLAQTGFAFLAQSDGNVLAIHEAGAQALHLRSGGADGKSDGVGVLQRYLKDSGDPGVASIALPHDGAIQYTEATIHGEPHLVLLQRLASVQGWSGPGAKIAEEQWTLGFIVPKREMYAPLTIAQETIGATRTSIVTTQIAITAGAFVVLMIGVYFVSRRVTGALVTLSKSASKMREGDYSARVEVDSADEVGQLGGAFNAMASEIHKYTHHLEELVSKRTSELELANQEIAALNSKLRADNLRMSAELNVAREIQLMVVPGDEELACIRELDLAGHMAPADEVGGDYYDVLSSAGGLKIGIGDVTGHGLESGVLMLMAQTAIRTLLAADEKDPARFLSIVNKVVYQNLQRIRSNKNMSLALLDYADGRLKVTGQHEEVIIIRNDGTVERVDTMALGMPIGIDEDIEPFVSSLDIDLAPGDLVALFSDGITEAENENAEQYGIERLCEVVAKNHDRPAKQVKDAIVSDVLDHIGTNKIYDDITAVVIKRAA